MQRVMFGATRRVCVREHPLPFFWGLSLRTGGATQDEGVTGDDGYRGSVVRRGV